MTNASRRRDTARRAAQLRAAQQRADRRRTLIRWAVAALGVLVLVGGVALAATNRGGQDKAASGGTGSGYGALGPEGVPIEKGTLLASSSSAATGDTVDGIKCESAEQVAYHVHAHLAVYVDGKLRPIPLGIGVVEPQVQNTSKGGFAQASRCYYWLHTHVQDGIIHIESPTKTAYTLGQFFDIWHQPLSSTGAAGSKGRLTIYVDGKKRSGDPRSIQLTEHEDIQIDVGSSPRARPTVDWSKAQL